ncbi:GntR family transcriptional regulator [Sulfitobacter sp. D35]|uniref:GntR family transcriptional regulator n=1 Tax=Sulfitobacter sp. D35 TaxID=3083252 RepID=UPI00296F0B85|nr:GntR family transcriptional regulator [Sulfitobacter sp. D35]MDW4497810.1 GntR family transcriptional regulator [Sulfitobacter sp. D35]
MNDSAASQARPRSVERIVDFLYREITAMRLLPGTRISETDVAAQFGVSRQPVREAFSRLAAMDLILVRPKKATEVRRFSTLSIEKSRFVRSAIESAALRKAAENCSEADGYALDAQLALQRKAQAEKSSDAFAELDYDFHRTICDIAGVPYAFDIIRAEKEKVDRLCMLQISKEDRMPQLIEDHARIADAIRSGDAEAAAAAGALHLSRLDETIAAIRKSSAAYFEDDPT